MKRLLIITQKVDRNDDILGFFHEWIKSFASQFGRVIVICLYRGETNLPPNVEVLSLGKEIGRSKLSYLSTFYSYIFSRRDEYDAVFVHMNPQYVLLGGILWRLWGKLITLWYAHGHTDLKLRFAELLSHIVFTSTEEGFRVESEKKKVVGQGIDTDLFRPREKTDGAKSFTIVSFGRITPSKDYGTLLRALDEIRKRNHPLPNVKIIGDVALESDRRYMRELEVMVKGMDLIDVVSFEGAVPNRQLAPYLQSADLSVNMSHTGSLDKTVLEAMAVGLPVLTCNEALSSVLENFKGQLMYEKKDHGALAGKIISIMDLSLDERQKLGASLRDIVVHNHNLPTLIKKISDEIKSEDEASVDVADAFNTRAGATGKDYEHRRWEKDPIAKKGYEMTLRAVHFLLSPLSSPVEKVLEVGPGPGTWTQELITRFPNAHFTLVDISREMLSHVKERFHSASNITTIESNFEHWQPTHDHDLFFSSRALEYMDDKGKVVKNIFDSLRVGGQGIIITKMPHYARNRFLRRKLSALHQKQIEPSVLVHLLRQQGFKNIRTYPVTFSFPRIRSVLLMSYLENMFGRRRLHAQSGFFAESYAVTFEKP